MKRDKLVKISQSTLRSWADGLKLAEEAIRKGENIKIPGIDLPGIEVVSNIAFIISENSK